MTFIVNKKTDAGEILYGSHSLGPYLLLRKYRDDREDINLIDFIKGSYTIGKTYFDYWKYV